MIATDTSLAIFAAVCLLNIADIYTTMRILAAGGREVNPVMAWLMGALGTVPALIGIKVLALGVAYAYLAAAPMWSLAALLLVYVAVLTNNVIQMRK